MAEQGVSKIPLSGPFCLLFLRVVVAFCDRFLQPFPSRPRRPEPGPPLRFLESLPARQTPKQEGTTQSYRIAGCVSCAAGSGVWALAPGPGTCTAAASCETVPMQPVCLEPAKGSCTEVPGHDSLEGGAQSLEPKRREPTSRRLEAKWLEPNWLRGPPRGTGSPGLGGRVPFSRPGA